MLKLRTLLMGTLVLTVGLALRPALGAKMPGPGPHATDAAHCTEDGPLSAEVAHDVLHMREEEKLARDVYLTLYDVWGLQIFNNISASEQRHMDAVLDLIVCYELIDPVVDDTVGVFTDPVFAALYVSLVDMGTNSVMSALQVGALIEELDIADLQIAIEQSDNPDVTLVFENLLQGSENHLRAFDKQITRAGGVYVPQYLTQEEYDAIVDGAGNNGSQHQNGAFTQSQERFRYLPTVDTTP